MQSTVGYASGMYVKGVPGIPESVADRAKGVPTSVDS